MHSKTMMILVGLGLAGCPASDDAADTGDTEAAGSDGTATSGGACTPGAQVQCVCTDGQQGAQVCNADGTGFDACECAGDGTTGGGSAGSGGTDTGSSADGTDTGAATTGETGVEGCDPGTAEACDCGDGPGVQRCTDAGELGPCECCMGDHPIVEGDLRYCEEGACYCGALMAMPPIDVCYVESIAELCCPGDIELTCY
jgi:hypothetical protein